MQPPHRVFDKCSNRENCCLQLQQCVCVYKSFRSSGSPPPPVWPPNSLLHHNHKTISMFALWTESSATIRLSILAPAVMCSCTRRLFKLRIFILDYNFHTSLTPLSLLLIKHLMRSPFSSAVDHTPYPTLHSMQRRWCCKSWWLCAESESDAPVRFELKLEWK